MPLKYTTTIAAADTRGARVAVGEEAVDGGEVSAEAREKARFVGAGGGCHCLEVVWCYGE
jgi:hypothetical protein